jgi:uncharacterized cupredoxin-like copper-binding protein
VSIVSSKPFLVRVALFGLALVYLVVLAFTVASLAVGDFEGVVFSLVIAIPTTIVALMLLKGGKWLYLVSAIISVFGLLFFLPNVPIGLGAPDSFFDFFSALAGTVGLLIAGIASAIAFWKARGGELSQSGSPSVVLALKGIAGVIAVLSVFSAVFTAVNIESVSASDKEGATIVTAKKVKWDVETIEASSSGTLKLVIKNSDPTIHTFTVEDLNMDFKVNPGSEKLIVLERPLAGEYEFICDITGHDDMKGKLIIR